MLILGRKVGEKVMIGDNICVSICSSHSNQIRLGFEAPADVAIHRQEIYEKIKKEAEKQKTD